MQLQRLAAVYCFSLRVCRDVIEDSITDSGKFTCIEGIGVELCVVDGCCEAKGARLRTLASSMIFVMLRAPVFKQVTATQAPKWAVVRLGMKIRWYCMMPW